MYCKVCGQDGPGDGICCTYCGSPFNSESIISNASSKIEIVEEMDTESLPKSRLGHRVEFTFPPLRWVLCIVFIILFLVLLCFPGFRRLIIRSFTPPNVLMKSVYSQALDDIFSQANIIDTQYNKESVAAEYQLEITNGDIALTLLADALGVDPTEIQGFSDVQILCDAVYDQNYLQAMYSFALCQKDIISLEQYVDAENQEQWLVFPELSDQALYVNMADNSSFSGIFEGNNQTLAKIDPQVLEDISIYYVKMLIEGFENINKSTENVNCGGISKRMTVINATVSSRQLCEILIEIIEDVSSNPDVAGIFYDMENQLGQNFYEDFLSSLELEKRQLQTALRQVDAFSNFTLYTYLNHKNKIVGVKLEYSNKGVLYPIFSCKTVTNGLQFGIEIEFVDSIRIQGSGKLGKGIDGTFLVTYGKQQICQIQLNDFLYKSDSVSGTFEIIPNEETVEHLIDQIDVYDAYLRVNRLSDFSIKINVIWNNENKNISATLLSNDELISKIYLSVEPKANKITNRFSADNALTAELWSSGINETAVDVLVEKLVGAGISRKVVCDYIKSDMDE